MPDDLLARARSWRDADPDPVTRTALDRLITAAANDPAAARELAACFAPPLAFGTAGLRAALGPGPARLNDATVARAAAGLSAWLLARGARTLVVGHDARTGSASFAATAAEVAAGAGLEVVRLPAAVPTPALAFSVAQLPADGGLMVTASHNPATDNGLKVYLAGGRQVVPPDDAEVAAAIAAVGPARSLRRTAVSPSGHDLLESYRRAASSVVPACAPRQVTAAVTALHGVGGETLVEVVRRAGFPAPLVVTDQQDPDPRFPTVAFPNPEATGAMDAVVALARSQDTDVALALDPDADRCGVAVPGLDGSWRRLTGDEVGALLAQQHLVEGVDGCYATTVVSASRLHRLAAAHGRPSATTLTGFKWLGRVPGLAYAYEEAIGYCVAPHLVADKDGITAALRVLQLVAGLRATGRTVVDALADLDAQLGVDVTLPVSVRLTSPTEAADRVAGLRTRPPSRLGPFAVTGVADLSDGWSDLPPTDAVRWELTGPAGRSGRVVVRPSGTEPLLKAYLEVLADPRDRPGAERSLTQLRSTVAQILGV